LKTSELVNDVSNEQPFATLTLVNGKSFQDVINVPCCRQSWVLV
jgi:hypothetical protein